MSSNYLYDALARSQRMLLLYSRLIFAKQTVFTLVVGGTSVESWLPLSWATC